MRWIILRLSYVISVCMLHVPAYWCKYLIVHSVCCSKMCINHKYSLTQSARMTWHSRHYPLKHRGRSNFNSQIGQEMVLHVTYRFKPETSRYQSIFIIRHTFIIRYFCHTERVKTSKNRNFLWLNKNIGAEWINFLDNMKIIKFTKELSTVVSITRPSHFMMFSTTYCCCRISS